VNGTAGPPGPSWVGSFAYAAYTYIPPLNFVDIVPNTPLGFNSFISQNITNTGTRLTVQNDGFYQILISLKSAVQDYIIVYVWKNGVQIPNGVFIWWLTGGPYPAEGNLMVAASAGDYFELVTTAQFLIGYPDEAAYSLSILQVA
jgi:hypothetical protein